jgi:hypothetical protein
MTRKKRTRWNPPASDESAEAGEPETPTTRNKAATAKAAELAPGQLTRNFSEKEVGKSSTALRLGINNVPPEEVLAKAKALAKNVLQPVRDHFGVPFSPGSWYRSEPLERVIAKRGFARWVQKEGIRPDTSAWTTYFRRKSHPKGEAADIEIPTVSNQDLFDWIKENCEFDQLIMEGGPDGWIHVSYREGDNRKEAFEIRNP